MYDTPGGIDQEKARRQHVEAVGERRGLDFVAIDHVADRNNVAQAWHHQRKPPTHAVGEAAAFLTQCPVGETFVKRERDRADPEAMARRCLPARKQHGPR